MERTLPVNFDESCNPDLLSEISYGEHGMAPMMQNVNSGRSSPIRGRTMKEYEQQISSLKKENFDLKLRIFFLDEKNKNKYSNEDIIKTNVELQVQCMQYKEELDKKKELLEKASSAIDSLSSKANENIEIEVQRIKEECEKRVAVAYTRAKDLDAQLKGSLEKVRELEGLQADIEDRDCEIARQNQAIRQIQKEFTEYRLDADKEKIELRDELENITHNVSRKDRDIQDAADDAQNTVVQLKKHLGEKDLELLDKDEMIFNLEDLLRAKEKELGDTKTKLEKSQLHYTKLKTSCSHMFKELQAKDNEAEELAKKVKMLEIDLKNVMHELEMANRERQKANEKILELERNEEGLMRAHGKKEAELENFRDLLEQAQGSLCKSEDAVEALQGQLEKERTIWKNKIKSNEVPNEPTTTSTSWKETTDSQQHFHINIHSLMDGGQTKGDGPMQDVGDLYKQVAQLESENKRLQDLVQATEQTAHCQTQKMKKYRQMLADHGLLPASMLRSNSEQNLAAGETMVTMESSKDGRRNRVRSAGRIGQMSPRGRSMSPTPYYKGGDSMDTDKLRQEIEKLQEENSGYKNVLKLFQSRSDSPDSWISGQDGGDTDRVEVKMLMKWLDRLDQFMTKISGLDMNLSPPSPQQSMATSEVCHLQKGLEKARGAIMSLSSSVANNEGRESPDSGCSDNNPASLQNSSLPLDSSPSSDKSSPRITKHSNQRDKRTDGNPLMVNQQSRGDRTHSTAISERMRCSGGTHAPSEGISVLSSLDMTDVFRTNTSPRSSETRQNVSVGIIGTEGDMYKCDSKTGSFGTMGTTGDMYGHDSTMGSCENRQNVSVGTMGAVGDMYGRDSTMGSCENRQNVSVGTMGAVGDIYGRDSTMGSGENRQNVSVGTKGDVYRDDSVLGSSENRQKNSVRFSLANESNSFPSRLSLHRSPPDIRVKDFSQDLSYRSPPEMDEADSTMYKTLSGSRLGDMTGVAESDFSRNLHSSISGHLLDITSLAKVDGEHHIETLKRIIQSFERSDGKTSFSRDSYHEHMQELQRLRIQLEKQLQHIEMLQEKLNEMTNISEEQLQEKDSVIGCLRDQLTDTDLVIKEKITIISDLKSEMTRKTERAEIVEKETEGLRSKVYHLEVQHGNDRKYEQLLTECRSQIEKLAIELEEMKHELKMTLSDLEHEREEVECCKETIDGQTKQLIDKESEIDELHCQNRKKDEVLDLQEKMCETTVEELVMKNREMSRQAEEQRLNCADYRKQIESQNSLVKELKERADNLRKELSSSSDHRKSLEQMNSKHKAKAEDYDQKIDKLKYNLTFMKTAYKRQKYDLNEAVRKMKDSSVKISTLELGLQASEKMISHHELTDDEKENYISMLLQTTKDLQKKLMHVLEQNDKITKQMTEMMQRPAKDSVVDHRQENTRGRQQKDINVHVQTSVTVNDSYSDTFHTKMSVANNTWPIIGEMNCDFLQSDDLSSSLPIREKTLGGPALADITKSSRASNSNSGSPKKSSHSSSLPLNGVEMSHGDYGMGPADSSHFSVPGPIYRQQMTDKCLLYHVNDSPRQLAQMTNFRIDSDLRSLFAIGMIEHFEKLKKETHECQSILKGMNARLTGRLQTFTRGPASESIEYGTLKELGFSVDELRVCVDGQLSMIAGFWTSELPAPNEKGEFVNQKLLDENAMLEEQVSHLKMQCQSFCDGGLDENKICESLLSTLQVVTKARQNFEQKHH